MLRTACICCGNEKIQEVIDLGMHPMADTFVARENRYHADSAYPLVCDLCPECGQIQLRTVTDPDERYVSVDYSYTSSNSSTSRAHWDEYAEVVSSICDVPAGARVVEIGSNDGYLLEQFQKRNFVVKGVEPSPVMVTLAKDRNVDTERAFFTLETARKLKDRLTARPVLIVANNVFNHANDPIDFASGIRELLAENGTFVFELPYWLCSIEQEKFDQIYHEHVSYFTVTYAVNLFRRIGMHVTRVQLVDYHGGSIRVYVRNSADGSDTHGVNDFMERESAAGLFDVVTYRTFMQRVHARRNKFLEMVYRIKRNGETIVCIGAAAKGNTFLNFCRLDASVVSYVTDSSPSKVGKLTPVTRIPIESDEVLANMGRVHVIILSWNIAELLREKLAKINPKIEILNPYA
jgi:SAM-dependent methyltransferase